jgi:hypothetical protein
MPAPDRPVISEIRPVPTDAELAAIMAAIEATEPRATTPTVAETPARWRFSGRWWTKPIPARRDRPY